MNRGWILSFFHITYWYLNDEMYHDYCFPYTKAKPNWEIIKIKKLEMIWYFENDFHGVFNNFYNVFHKSSLYFSHLLWRFYSSTMKKSTWRVDIGCKQDISLEKVCKFCVFSYNQFISNAFNKNEVGTLPKISSAKDFQDIIPKDL